MKTKLQSPRILSGLSVAITAAMVVGCGSSGPTTYPVSGVVTYKEAPVEGATVSFASTSGVQSASGKTDSEGKYTLTTFERGDGALPGEFKVRVVKYDLKQEDIELGDGTGPEEMGEDYEPPSNQEDFVAQAGPKNLLPEIYSSPTRTPLSYTVEEGENTFNVVLQDNP